MEKAIFISKPGNLAYCGPEYTRIYFGNEFCQRLIPSPGELEAVLDFAGRRGLQFTFVTPFVTDEGLDRLRQVSGLLHSRLPGAELVVNDWGVLRMLKREFGFSGFALGRLLTKQKRGPQIAALKRAMPEAAAGHFKASGIDAAGTAEFLADNGICRVELDNLLQGIERPAPLLRASLYFPFAYVTTSRYCIAAGGKRGKRVLRSIPPCEKECREYTFRLRHKDMPVDLLLKGNTQFFENRDMPRNLEQLRIDRIVYEPEIPV